MMSLAQMLILLMTPPFLYEPLVIRLPISLVFYAQDCSSLQFRSHPTSAVLMMDIFLGMVPIYTLDPVKGIILDLYTRP